MNNLVELKENKIDNANIVVKAYMHDKLQGCHAYKEVIIPNFDNAVKHCLEGKDLSPVILNMYPVRKTVDVVFIVTVNNIEANKEVIENFLTRFKTCIGYKHYVPPFNYEILYRDIILIER